MSAPSPIVKLAPTGFSLQERDRRHAAVRARMAARGLDYLLIPHGTGDWDNYQPDLRYLTCIGGGGMAAALVFPARGAPVAAVRESRRVAWWRASQDWVADVRSPAGFFWSRFFIEVLRELGVGRGTRIGIVGLGRVLRDPEGIISFGEFIALQKAFPDAAFECATEILYQVRKRKSAEEIAFVERAQTCADAIDDAFRAAVRPGAAEHDIYAAMFAAHIKAGGEVPCMILFSAERRFWQLQLLPTFRSLERGDVVMVEAEPKYYGYMAQAVISAGLRPLSDQEELLFDVSQECFDTLLSALRPGRSYADLIRTWRSIADRRGVAAGRTMGHGLGLGQDGPLTTPSGASEGHEVEEGDVLVLKPWIADKDDTTSVRVGGTVVVGAAGARRLGRSSLQPCLVT